MAAEATAPADADPSAPAPEAAGSASAAGGPARSARSGPATARARAKVNLHLHVLGRRDDGLHLLDSLCVFPDVADGVTVRPAPPGTFTIEVTGPFASGAPADSRNLALRAALALAEAAGRGPGSAAPLGVALSLEKVLPAAGGVGGGSADAAAVLHLLNREWGLDLSLERLSEIGLALGADLPVCLRAPVPTLMRGIGEDVRPAPGVPPLALVLANPGVPTPTGEVFARLRRRDGAPCALPAEGFATPGALAAWLEGTANMLEPPAREVAPAVADLIETLAAQPGCRLARMSGSGATCFGLHETMASAEAGAAALRASGLWAAAGRSAGA
ncbi:4-(cytidine 5'-diphospho)-2-C-methyl-D-erythritol kinase [Albimonas sp. CAU 1670]|uniref:4-(cytidine 5'-diphospho)-2-C-methyl-D-erythritol kinase n=1 Tax=Albimonas sp. CAU 1670 TaxID=3032599 RepID=UPI0023D9BC78|nr:4-(cytidine 5'-diphospho)-2-C-methyl-D-erythritol kinase [Albimonas sp. CAU 1670]MDF2233708.1 4-(cytidine 5'-diphospho)-2-C-methyl-D-erythritol kinase [Albimonas sp. CAU 1670]